MKILIVDKSGTLPVLKYGGTERVIWGLGKELTNLGHDVEFLVKAGSHCEFAKVHTLVDEEDIDSQIPEDIDVVHMNFRLKKPIHSKPYLVTMHGNPKPDEFIDINTVFISKNQAERYGSSMYVYNGLYWDDYPKPDLNQAREYVHFLGKADWKIKNVFGAIRVALKSGNEIHIMGGKRWTFRNLKRGLNFIFSRKVVFHGMVDNETKINISQKSKALIIPVVWHEPFGLAIIESLYAGCAVFGSKNGSLPELINKEVGMTSSSSKDLIDALRDFRPNPRACHDYAKTNFNAELMAKRYNSLYNKVLKGELLNKTNPTYIEKKNYPVKFD